MDERNTAYMATLGGKNAVSPLLLRIPGIPRTGYAALAIDDARRPDCVTVRPPISGESPRGSVRRWKSNLINTKMKIYESKYLMARGQRREVSSTSTRSSKVVDTVRRPKVLKRYCPVGRSIPPMVTFMWASRALCRSAGGGISRRPLEGTHPVFAAECRSAALNRVERFAAGILPRS